MMIQNEFEPYLIEVEKSFHQYPEYFSDQKANAKTYIGTDLRFRALPVPLIRNISKQGFSFSDKNVADQLAIWDYIWKQSSWFEVKSLALLYIEQHYRKNSDDLVWNTIKHWTPQIDNWAHSDGLSCYYSYFLERNTSSIYNQLLVWNDSSNLWERRQSLVSLFYYQRLRKSHLSYEQCVPLIKKLMHDEAYFVQKGVGWTLRELYQVYPEQTYDFVVQHASQITATAYYAASEKLSTVERENLKRIRKQLRGQ